MPPALTETHLEFSVCIQAFSLCYKGVYGVHVVVLVLEYYDIISGGVAVGSWYDISNGDSEYSGGTSMKNVMDMGSEKTQLREQIPYRESMINASTENT